MRLREFLSEITSLQTEWTIRTKDLQGRPASYIVSPDDGFVICPIVRLAREKTGLFFHGCDWREAAEAIGLSSEDRDKIVAAADNKGEPDLRRQLLEACRLQEI